MPAETTVELKQKEISWETNYNNKLDCRSFIHIDFAPKEIPDKYELASTIIKISTEDNSHQPIKAKIKHIVPIPNVQYWHSFVSHNMNIGEWQVMMQNKYGDDILKREMALYYYKKIKD